METSELFPAYPPTSQRELRAEALEALSDLQAILPGLFDVERTTTLCSLVREVEADVLALHFT